MGRFYEVGASVAAAATVGVSTGVGVVLVVSRSCRTCRRHFVVVVVAVVL